MSKKYFLLLLFVLQSIVVFSQDKNPVAKGFITIVTNQKIEFTNLRYEDDKVVFTNVETKTEFTYFLNTVKLIEDHNKNVVYRKEETPAAKNTVAETTKFETEKSVVIENAVTKTTKLETEKSVAIEAPVEKKQFKKLEFKAVSNILQDGKKLSTDEVRDVLKTNKYALKEYNSGKSTAVVGDFTLGLGIGLIIGGGINNLNKSSETSISGKPKSEPTLLIVGIVAGIIAIPIKISAKNKVRNSIETYNAKPVAMQNKMDIDLIVNGNGVGLAFKL